MFLCPQTHLHTINKTSIKHTNKKQATSNQPSHHNQPLYLIVRRSLYGTHWQFNSTGRVNITKSKRIIKNRFCLGFMLGCVLSNILFFKWVKVRYVIVSLPQTHSKPSTPTYFSQIINHITTYKHNNPVITIQSLAVCFVAVVSTVITLLCVLPFCEWFVRVAPMIIRRRR